MGVEKLISHFSDQPVINLSLSLYMCHHQLPTSEYIPHLNTAAFLVSSCRILSFEDIVRESDFHGGRTIFFDRSCTPNDFSDDDDDFFAEAAFFEASSGGGGGIGADLFCRLLVLGVISASAVFATFEGDDDDEHSGRSAVAPWSSGVGGRGSCCLRFLGVGPAEGVAGGSARLEAALPFPLPAADRIRPVAAVATLCLEALNMIWLSESLRILSISGRLIGSLRVLSSFFRVAASFRCFSMVLPMMSTQSSLRAFSSLEYSMSSSLPQDSWGKKSP